MRVMIGNYILEGIYFYSGFMFFYNLARNGRMTGSAQRFATSIAMKIRICGCSATSFKPCARKIRISSAPSCRMNISA